MATNRMQANLARRREIEQINVEKYAAVEKYFDKWGRTTNRYERWNTPEFYRPGEEKLKVQREQKLKDELAAKEREKARLIYEEEKQEFYRKLNEPKKPKPKSVPIETLIGINDTFKRSEEERRRLQLESNLYKKWRVGPSEETILLNARSDHEALAKLNWLDRQVAAQLERDQLKKENEERQLRLQEEARKHSEALNTRKLLRNEEIQQLKSIQSKHMEELKSREKEGDDTRVDNIRLQDTRQDIEQELVKFEDHIRKRDEPLQASNNWRRIKMMLRQCSDTVRNNLKFDIDLLQRIGNDEKLDQQSIDLLREKFEMQYDLEIQKQRMIEEMYESEAKTALLKQQEIWKKESQTREKMLKGLLHERLHQVNNAIGHNEKRQKELDDIREMHRQAIDSTVSRIKELAKEQKSDDAQVEKNAESFGDNINAVDTNGNPTIANCNGNETTAKAVDLLLAEASGRPKFGRKKVAWT